MYNINKKKEARPRVLNQRFYLNSSSYAFENILSDIMIA